MPQFPRVFGARADGGIVIAANGKAYRSDRRSRTTLIRAPEFDRDPKRDPPPMPDRVFMPGRRATPARKLVVTTPIEPPAVSRPTSRSWLPWLALGLALLALMVTTIIVVL